MELANITYQFFDLLLQQQILNNFYAIQAATYAELFYLIFLSPPHFRNTEFFLINIINTQMITDQKMSNNKVFTTTKGKSIKSRNLYYINNQSQKELKDLNMQDIELQSSNAPINNKYFEKGIQNAEVKQYVELFINKIKRGVASRRIYQKKQKKVWSDRFKSSIQGLQIPDNVVRVIVLISIFVTLTCLILSTFEGFIDDFSINYSANPEIIAIKIICLIFNMLYFAIKCISRFGHGELAIYVHEVFWAYAQSKRIFIDFISIVFQFMWLIFPGVMAVSGVFFFFLKIAFIFSLNDINSIQMTFFHRQKNILLWGIAKIAISNIIFGHLMASFLLAMSRLDLNYNWLIQASIQNEPWYIIYINAFYWGCTIMMTIGFGDILPANPGEKVVTGFLQMFSCALLGYNISTIGNLISELRDQNRLANRRKTIFRKMIRQRDGIHSNISKPLQIKILNYIRQSNEKHENLQYLERDEIIASLPQPMRKAYFRQVNVNIFPHVAFFNKLHTNTLLMISEKIVRKSYFPNQYLINNAFQQIVLLDQGEIGLAYKKKGSKLNGEIYDSFENRELLSLKLITIYPFSIHKRHNYYLISKNHALAWTIGFQQFEKILKQNSSDYQYYFTILHSHPFDSDTFNFKMCQRCSNIKEGYLRHHTIYDCPKVVYMPLREIIAQKFLQQYGYPQSRQKGNDRIKSIKWKSVLKAKITVKNSSQRIRDKMEQLAEAFWPNNYQMQNQERYQKQFEGQNKSEDEGDSGIDVRIGERKITQQRLQKIFDETLKKHQLGYEDEFWNLETDKGHNFKFYFPKFNAIKVRKVRLTG